MSVPPTLTERVAGAAAWNTLLFPARLIAGLAAGVLLFNVLTPGEYGVLALLSGLAATIGLYADPGIERSLPRFVPEVERRGGRAAVARFMRQIVGVKLAIVLLCTLLLLLLRGPLVNSVLANEQRTLVDRSAQVVLLQQQNASADAQGRATTAVEQQVQLVRLIAERGELFLLAVAALVVFGALYDIAMQFLTAYFKQRAWNVITIVVTLLQPLLIIAALLAGWRLSGVLLGMAITPVIAVLLAARQALQAGRALAPASGTAAPDATFAGRFTRFAAVTYVIQITTWFYDIQFVTFVLYGLGAPLTTVALVAFAYKFAKDYLGYAYMPFSGVLTPLLARIKGRNDPAARAEAYQGMTRIFALLLIPAGVGLVLLAPRMLELLYPQYHETVALIAVFVFFTFAESLLSVPHNLLMVEERYRPVLVARLAAMASVPLLIVLLPWAGTLGAAFAVGVARVAARLLTVRAVHRLFGLTVPWHFIGRCTAAALLGMAPLALKITFWPLPGDAADTTGKIAAALSLILFAIVGSIGYLVALKLLGGLAEPERRRLLGLKLPFKKTLARIL